MPVFAAAGQHTRVIETKQNKDHAQAAKDDHPCAQDGHPGFKKSGKDDKSSLREEARDIKETTLPPGIGRLLFRVETRDVKAVRDNIMLGSATLRQAQGHASDGVRGRPVLELAVSCAAFGEDLCTFPAGLETEIGELGIRVSGGQRQRMALARALVASGTVAPGLLVLDDPFSALDLDTEAKIVAGLRQLFGPSQPYAQQCTVVLFSHRLLAFPQADLVVVLDRGRILEQGTHAALSAGNGLYARIYRAQRLVSTG